jgi:thiosulfate dehydrogenase
MVKKIAFLMGAMVLALAACQQAVPSPVTSAPTELTGDPIRGGLLYDKWWVVLHVDAPDTDQPVWKTQSTNARSGSTTWRCKECHGWDYRGKDGAYGSGSHYTGFPGILTAQDKNPSEILAALKGGSNADHDFSIVMDELALIDLTLFIKQELVDTSTIVGPDKKAKGDNVAKGQTILDRSCATCHGSQGTAINFSANDADPEYPSTLAQDNPWEFIHKTRFGQPGELMHAGEVLGLTTQDYADLLAYVQTLPTESPLAEGGRLYDKWWKAIGTEAPTEDQPLWATQATNTRSGADTWRCKECHGWDYKGKDGAYGSGSHYTGFPGVLAARHKSLDEITAVLSGKTNPDHDFSDVLDEYALKALATFLREGVTDTQAHISADKTVNGNADRGETLYSDTCVRCHGGDGTVINFKDEAHPEYIGTIANGNPWEFFHKISFGQPGEPMPSGVNLGWTPQDIADVLTYAQTLPVE